MYYDFNYLSTRINKSKSRIYSAILKYGYSNFQLEILEYCAKENAISREQYYIDLLKPKYNLNSTAGSRLGRIHSEDSRVKMSISAQGRKHTEETKKLISLATKGINNPNFGKRHSEETKALISLARLGKSQLSESIKAKMSEKSGIAVKVIDLKTNEISVYTSITKAAKAMGVTQPPLSIKVKNRQGSFIVKKKTLPSRKGEWLRRRLLEYYNVNRLLNEKSMPICLSLLKHGYHNFSLTILEFCNINNLISREKYFFDIHSPEYNILKTPGSPNRGKGWRHSEATVEKIRIAINKRMLSPEVLAKMSTDQSSGIIVEVTDVETQTSTRYHAIRAAARALSIDKRYIEQYVYLNQDKPVLGKYTFKLISCEGEKPNPFNDPSIKVQKKSKKNRGD